MDIKLIQVVFLESLFSDQYRVSLTINSNTVFVLTYRYLVDSQIISQLTIYLKKQCFLNSENS